MQIAEMALKRKRGDLNYEDGEGETWCVSVVLSIVRRLLEVPGKPTKLWIQLYDCSGPNRVKLTVQDMQSTCGLSPTLMKDGEYFYGSLRLARILRPLIDRTVYLQVEYQ